MQTKVTSIGIMFISTLINIHISVIETLQGRHTDITIPETHLSLQNKESKLKRPYNIKFYRMQNWKISENCTCNALHKSRSFYANVTGYKCSAQLENHFINSNASNKCIYKHLHLIMPKIHRNCCPPSPFSLF